jgi:AP-1-like factor
MRKELHMREMEEKLTDLQGQHSELTQSYEALQRKHSEVKKEVERLQRKYEIMSPLSREHSCCMNSRDAQRAEPSNPLLFDVPVVYYRPEEGELFDELTHFERLTPALTADAEM